MKTLYIHIGTPKTATTSIQSFCYENRAVLEKNGFCFPDFNYKYRRTNVLRNGHFLVGRCYDKDGNRDIIEEDRLYREGLDRINELFGRFDNILLSDEGLWNGGYKKKGSLWEDVHKEAEEHGYKVKVIVYLRRQDGYASSWWNQQIKIGMRNRSCMKWESFIKKNPPVIQLDYCSGIEQIVSAIGRENMIVRRFGRKYFKDQSIYSDFLNNLGLKFDDQYTIGEEEKNIGLYGNLHEIKRILNGIPGLKDKDNIFFRELLLKESEKKDKSVGMLSGEETENLLKLYEEGNRKIAKEYFQEDSALFDMDFSNVKKWKREEAKLDGDIIRLVGEVAIELRKENKELRKRLNQQEKTLKKQQEQIDKMLQRLDHPVKNLFKSK